MKKQTNQVPSVHKETAPNFILINPKLAAVYQKYIWQQKSQEQQTADSNSFLIIDNQTGQIICE